MKLKDYMVGDWILSEHQFPMKVVSVGTDYLYADFEGNEGDVFEFYEKFMLKPIPLTPEILEKNGWTKCKYKAGTCRIIYEYEDSHRKHTMIKRSNGRWLAHIIDANKHPDEYMCCYVTLSMFYVHQLQHALRLCGLGELADNFKVE